MSLPSQDDRALPARGLIARIVESYNPGVTLLVLLWTAAFAVRERLAQRGMLERTIDDALRSLLYVVPIMLVGWGVLILADRRFRLGLFRKSED
jgi:hypothetical protein